MCCLCKWMMTYRNHIVTCIDLRHAAETLARQIGNGHCSCILDPAFDTSTDHMMLHNKTVHLGVSQASDLLIAASMRLAWQTVGLCANNQCLQICAISSPWLIRQSQMSQLASPGFVFLGWLQCCSYRFKNISWVWIWSFVDASILPLPNSADKLQEKIQIGVLLTLWCLLITKLSVLSHLILNTMCYTLKEAYSTYSTQ